MSISLLLPSADSHRPLQNRKPRFCLDPISPKKNQIVPISSFKTLPKIHDLFRSLKSLQSCEFEDVAFPKNLPKECLFSAKSGQSSLRFIDILTLSEFEISGSQEVFPGFSRKNTKTPDSCTNINNFENCSVNIPNNPIPSYKTLVFLPSAGNLESLEEIYKTLDSLYENVNVFHSLGVPESNFCFFLFLNGVSSVSLEILEKVFKKIDVENEIPYAQTFECRRQVFLSDLENFGKGKQTSLPIDSCYIYEMDYSPRKEKENQSFKVKVFWAVKLKQITLKETFIWLVDGFSRYFHPEFCAFLNVGAVLNKNSLWNAFIHFKQTKETGGVLGFEVSEKAGIEADSTKEGKSFYEAFDLNKFSAFGEFMEQIYGDWMRNSNRNFGVFRLENLNFNDENCSFLKEFSGFEGEMKGRLDFNKLIGLEVLLSKEIRVLENVEVSCKYPNKIEDLLKRKKESFDEKWWIMSHFFPFMIRSIKNNQNLSFSKKLALINKLSSHYLSLIHQSLSLCFMLSGIYLLSNLYLNEYSSTSFELLNIQLMSVAYCFLIICILFHYSFFFRPEEGRRDFQVISIFFSIIFNVYLAVFLWQVRNLLLYLSMAAYYMLPVLVYWKFSWKLIKDSLAYFWNKSLGTFIDIYFLASFKEDVSKVNSVFFENMLILNLLLSLVFMVLGSNEVIAGYIINAYCYYLIIVYCIPVLNRIPKKIGKEVSEFIKKRKGKNQIFAAGGSFEN